MVELIISYRLGQQNFSWTIVVEQFPQWDIKVHLEIKNLRCNMYSRPYMLLLMSQSRKQSEQMPKHVKDEAKSYAPSTDQHNKSFLSVLITNDPFLLFQKRY